MGITASVKRNDVCFVPIIPHGETWEDYLTKRRCQIKDILRLYFPLDLQLFILLFDIPILQYAYSPYDESHLFIVNQGDVFVCHHSHWRRVSFPFRIVSMHHRYMLTDNKVWIKSRNKLLLSPNDSDRIRKRCDVSFVWNGRSSRLQLHTFTVHPSVDRTIELNMAVRHFLLYENRIIVLYRHTEDSFTFTIGDCAVTNHDIIDMGMTRVTNENDIQQGVLYRYDYVYSIFTRGANGKVWNQVQQCFLDIPGCIVKMVCGVTCILFLAQNGTVYMIHSPWPKPVIVCEDAIDVVCSNTMTFGLYHASATGFDCFTMLTKTGVQLFLDRF